MEEIISIMISECQDASANIVIFQFLLKSTRKEFTWNVFVQCLPHYYNVKLSMGLLEIVGLTEFLAVEKEVECLLQKCSSTSIYQAWILDNIFKLKTFCRESRHLMCQCHCVTVHMAQRWLFTELSIEWYARLSLFLLSSSHCSIKKVQFLWSLKAKNGMVSLSWAAFLKYLCILNLLDLFFSH